MRHLEDELQISCVRAFEFQHRKIARLLHHSPNGGKRNAIEAARFKAMGVRAGFPDLILLCPNKCCHFLAMELKTKKGKQSPYQKEYQALIESVGGKYVVIRSLDQFLQEVNDYLHS